MVRPTTEWHHGGRKFGQQNSRASVPILLLLYFIDLLVN